MGLILISIIMIVLSIAFSIFIYLKTSKFKYDALANASGIIGITLIFVSFFFMVCFPKNNTKITEYEYIEAVGAKMIIENTNDYDMDALKLRNQSYEKLTKYWKQRENIEKNKDNWFTGSFYDESTLKKYPDVKINFKVKDNE